MTTKQQADKAHAAIREYAFGLIDSFGPGFILITDTPEQLKRAAWELSEKFQLITEDYALELVTEWQAEAKAEV